MTDRQAAESGTGSARYASTCPATCTTSTFNIRATVASLSAGRRAMRPWSRLFGVRVPRPSTRSHCVARGDRRGVASLDAVYREILGVGGSCGPDVPWDSRLIDRAVDDLARLGR